MNDIIENVEKYQLIGEHSYQEDLIIIFKYLYYECFFVFDGHGGKFENKLINYLNNKFQNIFLEFFKNKNINEDTITEFFKNFDYFIFKKKFNEGSCFSFLIINKLQINCIYGNLGDCGVFFFDRKNSTLKTIPHNFENEDEILRFKQFNYSKFIKNNRFKGINVSRSIGDFKQKKYFNTPFIGTPSIKKLDDIRKINYIVLFSDGLHQINEKPLQINKLKHEFYIYKIIMDIKNEKDFLKTKKMIDNTSFIIIKINDITNILLDLYYFESFYELIYSIDEMFTQSLKS